MYCCICICSRNIHSIIDDIKYFLVDEMAKNKFGEICFSYLNANELYMANNCHYCSQFSK